MCRWCYVTFLEIVSDFNIEFTCTLSKLINSLLYLLDFFIAFNVCIIIVSMTVNLKALFSSVYYLYFLSLFTPELPNSRSMQCTDMLIITYKN